MSLPTYSFLPWLRHGVANTIQSDDVENGGAVLRASVEVKMNVVGDPVGSAVTTIPHTKPVQLYGPGDVVGIEEKAIVKVEPRNWITNFEPNYLPYLEFYDEDFPWRYTPAKPGNHHRLRPWIMLAVLKADEFEEGKNTLGKPLPFINVKKQTFLPAPDDLWAWAHVHVNRSLNGADPKQVKSSDGEAVANALQNLLNQNADLASSRIICPRKLEENTTYYAFLVPVFESGRLAGLGRDFPANLTATKSAWGAVDAAIELPVYYRWQFSTGTIGDFEYLVRLLKPTTANPQVGRRDLDASEPGANLPSWQEAPGIADEDKTGGIFKLGGALRAPLSLADFNKIKKYELWAQNALPANHPFQESMAALLNLENDYKEKAAQLANQQSGLFDPPTDADDPEDLDPVITPPIYGRWHAKTNRLLFSSAGAVLPNRQNWVHELNLDPRFRTAAGFGTRVVQKNQEDYMYDAWKQIGEVLKGNQVIRQGQVSLVVSQQWYSRHLEAMATEKPENLFYLTAPVHRKVIVTGITLPAAPGAPVSINREPEPAGITLAYAMKHAVVPPAMTSAPMRRLMRPGGRLVKKLGFSASQPVSTILQNINEGRITTAPPKTVGAGVATLDKDVQYSALPPGLPSWLANFIQRWPNLAWIVVLIAMFAALILLLIFYPAAWAISAAIALAFAGIVLFLAINRWKKQLASRDSARIEALTPEMVSNLPARPDFSISFPPLKKPGEAVELPNIPAGGGGETDNQEAALFRESILDLVFLADESAADSARPPKIRLDFPQLQTVLLEKLHPANTIPARVMGNLALPSWLNELFKEVFEPVMAYPRLDYPMYKPLEKISSELFLPNIRLIENNTISLLKTNQKFIESYMVGLNHEFARELLWREYPTDQRGSSFRQFWDVSTIPKPAKFEPVKEAKKLERQWRDKIYDIPEIHTWSLNSDLGKHDHRELPGKPQEEEVVLVIRGELLKKYPNAVIYAHKAAWAKNNSGNIDNTKIRSLAPMSAADEADLDDGQVAGSNKILKTPLYSAKVDPDIYFFGFDLTVEEVRGANGDEPDAESRPGWFFVIKERPGEPRFGLDIDKGSNSINGWNELSWEHVKVVNGSLDVGGSAPAIPLVAPIKQTGETQEAFDIRKSQFEEDKNMTWSEHTNAAELAYILYQVPVLVAVHGAEMLPADLAPGDL